MRKFRGSLEELQELVATTGIDGEWVESRQQTQYRTDSGAILNYWESTGTVNFQGSSLVAQELEAAMFPARTGVTGACCLQPDNGSAVADDAVLQGLISGIIENRVGPIFDEESAQIGKIALRCMLDLCERLEIVRQTKKDRKVA